MPQKKGSVKTSSGSEIQKHLDNVKKDLKELTTKISKTNRKELTKLSYEASKTVGDTASEIIRNSSVLLDKAFKVLHGALEGGKKAMEQEKSKVGKRKTAPKKPATPKRKTITAGKTASSTAVKKNTASKKTATPATKKRTAKANKTTKKK